MCVSGCGAEVSEAQIKRNTYHRKARACTAGPYCSKQCAYAHKAAPRRKEVIDCIVRLSEKGYPPTLRELGIELGIRSTNGVSDHLKSLRSLGLIAWNPRMSRTLRVL